MYFTWYRIQICICWSQIPLKKNVWAWIRKLVSIWCDQHLPQAVRHICTSTSYRVDQAVDCGLWNVVPLLFNGCAKLLDIGGTWKTLSYTSIQSNPNMLNAWHLWCYAGHGRTGTFFASMNCVQILATWGYALSCWNMRWWQRMNGTTMGLGMSSRYHDISKPLAHTTPYTLCMREQRTIHIHCP